MAKFPVNGATSSPLDGLALGMSVEDAWQRAPALRRAFRIEMEASAYAALQRRLPELGGGSLGGNRFGQTAGRLEERVSIDGVRYALRFDQAGRLRHVSLHFPDDAARTAAVATWGKPDVREWWRVWTDPAAGTQAALTDCSPDDVPKGCAIELMPYQPLASAVAAVFPEMGTLVGRTEESLPFGPGVKWSFVRYYLPPLVAGLWIPLEVQFTPGPGPRTVVAYRTVLAWTYAASTRQAIWTALRAAVPDLAPVEPPLTVQPCWEGHRAGVRVGMCEQGSTVLITVGEWTS